MGNFDFNIWETEKAKENRDQRSHTVRVVPGSLLIVLHRLVTLAHTNWQDHSTLSALTLGGSSSDLLDSFVGSLATSLCGLGVLLLGLEGLGLAVLDFLSGSVGGLVTVLTGLSLLSADLLDGHANDGTLDAGGLAGSLLCNIGN